MRILMPFEARWHGRGAPAHGTMYAMQLVVIWSRIDTESWKTEEVEGSSKGSSMILIEI